MPRARRPNRNPNNGKTTSGRLITLFIMGFVVGFIRETLLDELNLSVSVKFNKKLL